MKKEEKQQQRNGKLFAMLSFIFRTICILMCILNLIYVTFEYFKYSTVTKTAPYSPIEQIMPLTSLCFPTFSLTNKNTKRTYFEIDPYATLNHKIGEIFNSTPPADSILKSCSYRNFELDLLWKEYNVTACNEYFNVKRYRMYGYMCYRFSPNYTNPYIMHSVTYSFDRARTLYQLSINSPFDKGLRMLPIIHFSELPDDEVIFNEEILTSIDDSNYYILSYELYESSKLTYPYDTDCGGKPRIPCYAECMEKHYREKGFTIVGGINTEHQQADTLLIPDYSNASYSESVSAIYNKHNMKCRKKCDKLPCFDNLVITYTSDANPGREKLSIIVETARKPVLKVKFVASTTFVDFIIRTTSIAGFWLGFSVVSTLIKTKNMTLGYYINQIGYLASKAKLIEIMKHREMRKIRRNNMSNVLVNHESCKRGEPRKKFFLIISITIYKIFVLAYLLRQIYLVSELYFAFETISKVTVDLNPLMQYPSMTFCLQISDLIAKVDAPEINNSIYDPTLTKLYSAYELSVNEIMNRSLSSSQFLSGCRIRLSPKHFSELYYKKPEVCMKNFFTRKFYLNKQICYLFYQTFTSKINFQSSWRDVLNSPGIMFTLILNPDLARFERIGIAASSGSDYPITSSRYSAFSYKTPGNRLKVISYHFRFVTSLPRPYDTKCSFHIRSPECIQKCLDKCFTSKVNRIPFTHLLTEGSEKRIVSYKDLKNKTVYDLYLKCNSLCKKNCKEDLCHFNYTKTYISGTFRSTNKIEVAMDLPTHPNIHYEAVAIVSLYDYYYQIFSSISFWLGFTFIGVNPVVHYFNYKREKVYSILEKKVNFMKRFIESIQSWLKSVTPVQNCCVRGRRLTIEYDERTLKVLVTYFFCSLGSLVFLYMTVSEYSAYATDIKIINRPENMVAYNVSLCYSLESLFMDGKMLQNEAYHELKSQIFNRTIDQLFRLTPSPDSIMNGCGYRGVESKISSNLSLNLLDGIFFLEKNKNLCQSIFNIDKYILKTFVCYKFSRKRFVQMERDLNVELNDEKYQYMIAVSRNKLARHFFFSVHFDYPFLSAYWSSTMTKKRFNQWYSISYIRYDMGILPPPYTKDGFDDLFFNKCLDDCMKKKLAPFNKSQTSRFNEPSNVTLITYKDRKNSIIRGMIDDIVTKCRTKCDKIPFVHDKDFITYTFIVTIINEEKVSDQFMNKSTTFYLSKTDYPVVNVIFRARMSLIDLIINIGSIFSIWFGISAMSLDSQSSGSRFDNSSLSKMSKQLDSLIVQMGKLKKGFRR